MTTPATVLTRIQHLQQRCGCVAGSIAMLVALVLLGVYLYRHVAALPLLKTFMLGAAGFFAALVIGLLAKLAALAVTRLQIRYLRWKYQIS